MEVPDPMDMGPEEAAGEPRLPSGPTATESGPAPGGFMAVAERFSQSVAGGYGLKDRSADVDPADRRRALLRLALTFAAITAVAVFSQAATRLPLFTIEVAILVLMAVIMLHELGHLAVAKRCGIKVTEYFVGFGPRLWSFRRGETEYGIKPVMLGGYVRIIGMNNLEAVPDADEGRTYRQQAWYKRVAVSLAGPAVHFIIAFVLFFVVYGVVGQSTAQPRIAGVETLANGDRSPAQIAGFQVGDRILSIDGRPANPWDKLVTYIQSKPGVPLSIAVQRGASRITLTATPADASKIVFKDAHGAITSPAPGGKPIGLIGLEPTIVNVPVGPLTALGRSATSLGSAVRATILGVGHIFSPHALTSIGHQVVTGNSGAAGAAGSSTSPQNPNRPVSMIGIGRLATQAASNGLATVLGLIIMLNLFLGVLNLIPLLPFDGGHIAIAIYEGIRSRHGKRYWADINKMMPATYALLLVLVFLMLSGTYLDLTHPIANPFR